MDQPLGLLLLYSFGWVAVLWLRGAYRPRARWTIGSELGDIIRATLVMALLFYAWCELLPKMLFTRFPNRLTLLVAPLFRGIHFALRPLVDVTTTLSNGLLRWTGGRVFTGHLFANRDESVRRTDLVGRQRDESRVASVANALARDRRGVGDLALQCVHRDERMTDLQHLGVRGVRLMSNNPEKIQALEQIIRFLRLQCRNSPSRCFNGGSCRSEAP